MRSGKDRYEELIMVSPVFAVDRDKEPARYKRESLKLVEYLYSYLMEVNKTKYEPYGLEIVEVAKRCINNFTPDTGVFLHYFTRAWKTEYEHLQGREIIKKQFRGLRFTEEQCRAYRKYQKLAKSFGTDTNTKEFNAKIAEVMGLSEKEVNELKQMINSKPTSGMIVNSDGEEYNLIDQIEGGVHIDAEMIEKENFFRSLSKIQTVFDGLQERQKPLISALLTAKIMTVAQENNALLQSFQKTTYFNRDVCEARLGGEELNAKDIADAFGVAEASISRTWKTFKNKLKNAGVQNI